MPDKKPEVLDLQKQPDEERTNTIDVTLTDEVRAALQAEAGNRGVTLEEYVLWLAHTRAAVVTSSEQLPPPCTREQLLAVACPTCGAAIDAYCEERPGKVLLLAHHHAERFWVASAEGAVDN